MAQINLDMLTMQEKAKLGRILKMVQENEARVMEVETNVLEEQIKFIRRYGERKLTFYSNNWYMANEKRTKALYFKTRNEYVKNFRFQQKKVKNRQN